MNNPANKPVIIYYLYYDMTKMNLYEWVRDLI